MQTKSLPMSSQLSEFLNLARWMAALLVVLHHARHLWFMDLSNVTNKSLSIKVFYFFTGFGGEAVMVFFLLSGFLVGGGALKKMRENSFNATDYMISRISRIYTVLVPALICGGLLDWIGLRYLNGTEIYTNSAQYKTKSLGFVIADNLDISTFMSNLFNLQGTLSHVFGSNTPLWSLSYEWWYYCLFALILTLMSRKTSELSFWISAVCIVAAVFVFPFKQTLYFSVWMLGAWIATIESSRFRISPVYAWAIFILLASGSRISHIYFDSLQDQPIGEFINFLQNFLVAAGFSILILSIRNIKTFVPGSNSFHMRMADFSYTIYLLHVPMLVFITALLSDKYAIPFFVQPATQVFFQFSLILISIYIGLYFFSQVTEKFTPNVKSYLIRVASRNRQITKTESI